MNKATEDALSLSNRGSSNHRGNNKTRRGSGSTTTTTTTAIDNNYPTSNKNSTDDYSSSIKKSRRRPSFGNGAAAAAFGIIGSSSGSNNHNHKRLVYAVLFGVLVFVLTLCFPPPNATSSGTTFAVQVLVKEKAPSIPSSQSQSLQYPPTIVLMRSIDNLPWTKLAHMLELLERILQHDQQQQQQQLAQQLQQQQQQQQAPNNEKASTSSSTTTTTTTTTTSPPLVIRRHWFLNRLMPSTKRVLPVKKLLEQYNQSYTIIDHDAEFYRHLPYNYGYAASEATAATATTANDDAPHDTKKFKAALALRHDKLLYAANMAAMHNYMLDWGRHNVPYAHYLLPWRMTDVIVMDKAQPHQVYQEAFFHSTTTTSSGSASTRWSFSSSSQQSSSSRPDVIVFPVQSYAWDLDNHPEGENGLPKNISTASSSTTTTTISTTTIPDTYAVAVTPAAAATQAKVSPAFVDADAALWDWLSKFNNNANGVHYLSQPVSLMVPDNPHHPSWLQDLVARYPSSTPQSSLRLHVANTLEEQSLHVTRFVPFVPQNDTAGSSHQQPPKSGDAANASITKAKASSYFISELDWQDYRDRRQEKGVALFYDMDTLKYERRLHMAARHRIPTVWHTDRLQALTSHTIQDSLKKTAAFYRKDAGPWYVQSKNKDRIYQSAVDRTAWQAMARNITTWALSYYYSDDGSDVAKYAVKQLKEWFWSEGAMQPKLMLSEKNSADSATSHFLEQVPELPDMMDLVYLLDAVRLLRQGDWLKSRQDSLFTAWCRDFLNWLVEHHKAGAVTDESNNAQAAYNNNNAVVLGIYYDAIVAALASFIADDATVYRIFTMTPHRLPAFRDFVIQQASCKDNDEESPLSLRRMLQAWHAVARQSQSVNNLWKVQPWWNEKNLADGCIPQDPLYGKEWSKTPSVLCEITTLILNEKCATEIEEEQQQQGRDKADAFRWGPILDTYRRFCRANSIAADATTRHLTAATRYHMPPLHQTDHGVAPFWNLGYRKFL